MKYNFQKAEEIYIPYVPNNELNGFLISNFEIQNNNIEEIISFIKKPNIKKLVFDLPNIISNEFFNDKLQIDLSDEHIDGKKILEITILSTLDVEISVEKENKIYVYLYDNYSWNDVDKIFINMEYAE